MNRHSKRHINAVNVTASINSLIQSITTCFDWSLGTDRSICSFLVFDNEEMKHFTDLISTSMKAVDSFRCFSQHPLCKPRATASGRIGILQAPFKSLRARGMY